MKLLAGIILIALILIVGFVDHSLPWRIALIVAATAFFTWDIIEGRKTLTA